MAKRTKDNETSPVTATELLAQELEVGLLREYGPILTGESLRRALGYPSLEALRQGVSRGTIPVPVFALENRRGKFALAKDVARWLAEQRTAANIRTSTTSERN